MSDSRLPHDIRASFTRLMLHLHVVRGSPVAAVRHARLWKDVPTQVSVEGYQSNAHESYIEGSRMRQGGAEYFRDILHIVDEYLEGLRRRNADDAQQWNSGGIKNKKVCAILNDSAAFCD